jgi:hypothetical protein
MQRRARLILVSGVFAALGACASSTKFTSTWKDPSAEPLALQGKKAAAIVLSSNETLRRNAETTLARELASKGVYAIPGYQLLGDEPVKDKEAVRQKLQAAGIDTAVVMRVVDRRQEVTYVPPAPGPYYGSFSGYYGYGWSAVSDPGYMQTTTIVSVETLLYSVSDDKLLWGGVSDTADPKKLDHVVKDVVEAAAKEMKKAGLIAH